jgi:hypothetical protein
MNSLRAASTKQPPLQGMTEILSIEDDLAQAVAEYHDGHALAPQI